jgi:hypothetical protein
VAIVILLVVVVLLWIAVLAPSAWRRFGERQSVGSIDHFHHQLQLLEHAAPKTVAPAYRLHTSSPGSSAGPAVHAVDQSRPKLVLLRPTDDAAAADVEDGEGGRYERVGVLDRPEPVCVPDDGADLSAYRRDQARHRCTLLLRCLCGVAVSTAVIGVVPRMHLVWVLTVLSGVAALGLFALIAYARAVEDEQRRRRSNRPAGYASSSFTSASASGSASPSASPAPDVAVLGYPGAWDEETEPQVAAR